MPLLQAQVRELTSTERNGRVNVSLSITGSKVSLTCTAGVHQWKGREARDDNDAQPTDERFKIKRRIRKIKATAGGGVRAVVEKGGLICASS